MIVLLSTYVASGHTLADADAAAQKAGACLVIDVNYTLTAAATLNAPYVTVAGGIITRGAFNLALNGVFSGSDYDQLTEATGTGRVWFGRQKRISIRWLGGVLNGTADDTRAFQQTINAAAVNGVVNLTEGVLKMTSGVTVANDGVRIEGAGTRSLQIRLYPTAPMAAITFSQGTKISYRNALTGVWFYSSDATYQKIAVDLYDCSEFEIDDVYINGSVGHNNTGYWSNDTGSGGNSIGLRTHGRDHLETNRLSIIADMPIQVCKNPNTPANVLEDLDVSHLAGLFLTANGNPHVTIDPNVGLSNVSFEARQSWVLGTYGVYCKSTFGSQWINVIFRNLRTEQGTSATAWTAYIDCGSCGITNLTFDNCTFDSQRQGAYLRGSHRTLFESCQFQMLNSTAVDILATAGDAMTASNCLADASAKLNVASMVRLRSNDCIGANPLAFNADYVYWNGQMTAYPSRHLAENARQFSWTGPLASGANMALPISPAGNGLMSGRGFIHAVAGTVEASSDFVVSANGIKLLNPTSNFVTATAAGTLALVWNSGSPTLYNSLGVALNLNVAVDWRN